MIYSPKVQYFLSRWTELLVLFEKEANSEELESMIEVIDKDRKRLVEKLNEQKHTNE